jgi:hypothetical protein
MKRPVDDVLTQGLVGGVVAGIVVATWFLVVDVVAGQPFQTPALLAYFFFQRETLAVTPQLVVFYTILHFGVFAFLGLVTSWALAAFGAAPRLWLGAIFGVVVLDLVFYGALLVSGADLFSVLPGEHVLGSNLLGGVVLMAYLHRASGEERPLGWGALRGRPVVTQGLLTGVLGAVAVALWFLALDLMAGHPFRTPGALGAALFFGAQGPSDFPVSPALIAGYTVLHLGVFSAFGILFVGVARGLERAPQFALLVALAFIVLEALVLPVMALSAEWVLGTVGWWSVAVGNAVAIGAMAWRVWRTHPTLRRMLHGPVGVRT